jgi:hypothetical protein
MAAAPDPVSTSPKKHRARLKVPVDVPCGCMDPNPLQEGLFEEPPHQPPRVLPRARRSRRPSLEQLPLFDVPLQQRRLVPVNGWPDYLT